MKEVIVSAPGKILWTGGYSILEKDNIGLVSSVDKRVYARANVLPDHNIEINAPQLGVSVKGKFENGKIALTEDNPHAKFVKIAIETTLTYLKAKKKRIKGISIHTYSDPAFGTGGAKSGLGSSAAVTVASIAAVLKLHGISPKKNLDLLHKLAQYSHSTSQGKVGSGFDVSASVYGGHEYSRYSPHLAQEPDVVKAIDATWDHSTKPLILPRSFVTVVANIPGASASTTEMVAKVKDFKEVQRAEYDRIINEINQSAKEANNSLAKLNEAAHKGEKIQQGHPLLVSFIEQFEKSRNATRELGEKSGAAIEPANLSAIITESKSKGAFVARLPGAGGGDAIAAICLSRRDATRLKKFWAKKGLEVLDLKVTGKGIAIEKQFPKTA
ncbi:MAG: hypothetical protein Q8R15_04445 [Candidatus Micrarchaeota archaeon]|nr:hypothetical protein [Candidatus Micrarchaeota archaeon]